MIKDKVRASGAANDTVIEEVYLNVDSIVRFQDMGDTVYIKLIDKTYYHSVSTLEEILEQLKKGK